MLDPDLRLQPHQLQPCLHTLDRSHRNRLLNKLGHCATGQGKARELSLYQCAQILVADVLIGHCRLSEPAALQIAAQLDPQTVARVVASSTIAAPDSRAQWVLVATPTGAGYTARVLDRDTADRFAEHFTESTVIRVALDPLLWTLLDATRTAAAQALPTQGSA